MCSQVKLADAKRRVLPARGELAVDQIEIRQIAVVSGVRTPDTVWFIDTEDVSDAG